MHPASLPIDTLLIDCRIRTGRRSGPGGQHRNKVETAVVVEHLLSGLSGEATERRSQSANRVVAIFRLRLRLAVDLRSQWVTQGLPAATLSALWRQRAVKGRLAVASEHDDLPSILAEALDHLAIKDWKVPEASEQLEISSTQLIRLLKKHPPALQMLNQRRKILGLNPLQ
jgi:hypothetical protein